MNMYSIGFLGLGKMGSSILNGILANNLYPKENIAFYAPSKATQEKGIGLGINLAKDENNLVNDSKIIILAIEPQKYNEVFQKLIGKDYEGKAIVSLAPGKTISYLKSVFVGAHIIRAMPNTPSVINKGVTTLAFDNNINQEVVDIFSSIGTYVIVKEEQIDTAIPLHGSMPAYIFTFIKAFVEASKEYGIDEEAAKELAVNAIIGSCELALSSDKDLDELIDSVCSRGGATIAGLDKLREKGFNEAIKQCYKACVDRSEELKNS